MTMGIALLGTLMIQQAINYMMIQSQALGIVAEPINIITLVTENKTASLDNHYLKHLIQDLPMPC